MNDAERTPSVALPVNDMEIVRIGQDRFFLFLDIFVHPARDKIVAVCCYYHDDWDALEHGVDYQKVELITGDHRVCGHYIPYRLESWEPCILLDFADPALSAF
jgi:hypothetical protein